MEVEDLDSKMDSKISSKIAVVEEAKKTIDEADGVDED